MGGNTVYLNGLECLCNEQPLPVNGLGNIFKAINNLNIQKAKGLNTTPAKVVLAKEISLANEKMVGKQPVLPMVVPAVVKPAVSPVVKPVVTPIAPRGLNPFTPIPQTPKTDVLPPLLPAQNPCKQNCSEPNRTLPGANVKVDLQTGQKPKKQIRNFNAQELNAMTRVVIEPIKKMLVANLEIANKNPEQLAPLYNVPVYKQFIMDTLANWDNPAALKEIFKKYNGKVENTQTLNQREQKAAVMGLGSAYVDITKRFPVLRYTPEQVNGLSGLWDDITKGASNFVEFVGDGISNAANYVKRKASDAWDWTKESASKSVDFLKEVGIAIGEGLKNAAVWTVGMLQKYNPLMIAARSAFRGLLAVNFRGWASDMQGMRDRGEENKIKEVWTGTLVGGNWGDLVASINAGSGRSKVETGQAEYQKETIEAPPLPPEMPNIEVLKDLPQSTVNEIIAKYNAQGKQYSIDYGVPFREMRPFDVSGYKAAIGKQETVKVEPGTSNPQVIIAPPKPQNNPITILPSNEVKLPVNNKANVVDTGAAFTFNTSTPYITSNSNNLQLVTPKGFTSGNNLTFVSGLGSLGEAVSTGSLLTAATPVILKITDLITKAKEVADEAKKIKEEYVDPLINQGGGSNNPQPNNPPIGPGTTEPPNSNPNNNPGSGGGNAAQPETKSNTTLIIGLGIAAVLVLALTMNKGNAAPNKNLSGLGNKTVGKLSQTTKTSSIKNFKL